MDFLQIPQYRPRCHLCMVSLVKSFEQFMNNEYPIDQRLFCKLQTLQGPSVFVPASCLTYGPVTMSGLYYMDYFVICYLAISVLRDVRNVFNFITQKYQNFRQHDSGSSTPIGRSLSTTSSSSSKRSGTTPQVSEVTVHSIDLEYVYQLSEVHKAWIADLLKNFWNRSMFPLLRFVSENHSSSTAPATPVSGTSLQELHCGEGRCEGNVSLWNMSAKTELQEKSMILLCP